MKKLSLLVILSVVGYGQIIGAERSDELYISELNRELLAECKKKNADPAMVVELLASGADVNAAASNGYTPLIWACQQNNLE